MYKSAVTLLSLALLNCGGGGTDPDPIASTDPVEDQSPVEPDNNQVITETDTVSEDQQSGLQPVIRPLLSISNWLACSENDSAFGAYTGLRWQFDNGQYTQIAGDYSDPECLDPIGDLSVFTGDFRIVGTRPSIHGFTVERGEFIATQIGRSLNELIDPLRVITTYRDIHVSADDVFFITVSTATRPSLDGTGAVTLSIPYLPE